MYNAAICLPDIMPFLPTYHSEEGGHDTFTCRIVCKKNRFWLLSLIGRETIFYESMWLPYFKKTGQKLLVIAKTKRVYSDDQFLSTL